MTTRYGVAQRTDRHPRGVELSVHPTDRFAIGVNVRLRPSRVTVGLGPLSLTIGSLPEADDAGPPDLSELTLLQLLGMWKLRRRTPGDVTIAVGVEDGIVEVYQHGQCLGMGESIAHALADATHHVANGEAPHDPAWGGQLR